MELADEESELSGPPGSGRSRPVTWAWRPPLPLKGIPVFVWPPRPVAALKWFASLAFLGSVILPFGALAGIAWFYLQPALERCVHLQIGWILEMYARNLGLMLVVAGSLHLFFYTFRRQGSKRKFDSRDLSRNNRKFLGRNQVWDNIFWSCASGVTFWTAYEVLFMWAYANDMLPYYLDWKAHPIWFASMFAAIIFWTSFHFYFTHRLLHWKPLYRVAHSLHHRNDNVGPWSGFSMHPIEHIIYLSSVLIHLVIASHPIHIFFHMQWNALGAASTHSGFESLLFKGKSVLSLGSFHHQLHHRFYDCNYGNEFTPCDKWFGTNHDGTQVAMTRIRERRRARHKVAVDNA